MALYAANYYVTQYLSGKGLDFVSYDYRYYYFTEGTPLTEALAEMPDWYKINFANLWQ